RARGVGEFSSGTESESPGSRRVPLSRCGASHPFKGVSMLRWQRWSAVSGALFAGILCAAILLSRHETDSTQSVDAWFSDSEHQARPVAAFFLGVAASLAFLAFM